MVFGLTPGESLIAAGDNQVLSQRRREKTVPNGLAHGNGAGRRHRAERPGGAHGPGLRDPVFEVGAAEAVSARREDTAQARDICER